MRTRFKPWQLAACLILVCCVILAAVIALRRSNAPHLPDLVSSLPPEAGATLSINLRDLRSAGVFDTLLGSKLGEDAEYKKFVEQTNFDYKTDLDQVLLRFTPKAKYMLLTGRFDWKRLIDYAQRNGGNCRNGYCSMPGSTPDKIISYYALRPNIMALAVGSDPGSAYFIKPRKMQMVELPATPVWMTVPGDVLRDYNTAPEGTRVFLRALSTAQNVLLTLGSAGDRFEAGMNVTCKNAEDAAILRAQLEGVTGELRKMIAREKQTPNPGDLSGVLTSGSFQRDQQHVIGKWPIERSFLYSLSGG